MPTSEHDALRTSAKTSEAQILIHNLSSFTEFADGERSAMCDPLGRPRRFPIPPTPHPPRPESLKCRSPELVWLGALFCGKAEFEQLWER